MMMFLSSSWSICTAGCDDPTGNQMMLCWIASLFDSWQMIQHPGVLSIKPGDDLQSPCPYKVTKLIYPRVLLGHQISDHVFYVSKIPDRWEWVVLQVSMVWQTSPLTNKQSINLPPLPLSLWHPLYCQMPKIFVNNGGLNICSTGFHFWAHHLYQTISQSTCHPVNHLGIKHHNAARCKKAIRTNSKLLAIKCIISVHCTRRH